MEPWTSLCNCNYNWALPKLIPTSWFRFLSCNCILFCWFEQVQCWFSAQHITQALQSEINWNKLFRVRLTETRRLFWTDFFGLSQTQQWFWNIAGPQDHNILVSPKTKKNYALSFEPADLKVSSLYVVLFERNKKH
jgi:hypothetical protein